MQRRYIFIKLRNTETVHRPIFRCCCGLPVNAHTHADTPPLSRAGSADHLQAAGAPLPPLQLEHWNPAKHTLALPTDAYGCIDFRGGTQTNKAQVRESNSNSVR